MIILGDYDIITKDLFEKNKEEYVAHTLNKKVKKIESIATEFQKAQEFRSDKVFLVETEEGEKFILHVEFQTKNDISMPYRMIQYYGFLQASHPDAKIFQQVIYTGEDKCRMNNTLREEVVVKYNSEQISVTSIDYRYDIIDIGEKTMEEIILSKDPIKMAFLPAADRELRRKNPQQFLKKLIDSIEWIAKSDIKNKQYIITTNLIYSELVFKGAILVNELLEKKGVFNMVDLKEIPIIRKYIEEAKIEAKTEGKIEGKFEGEKIGAQKAIEEIAIKMLKDNKDAEEVQKYTGLTSERIRELTKMIAAEQVDKFLSENLKDAKTAKKRSKL